MTRAEGTPAVAGMRQGRMDASSTSAASRPQHEAVQPQTTQALRAREAGREGAGMKGQPTPKERRSPRLTPALLTDQGHHQDEFPAVQESYQAAEVVDEAIGVWDQEDGSDLQLHLPHLTLVFQHSLEEKDI